MLRRVSPSLVSLVLIGGSACTSEQGGTPVHVAFAERPPATTFGNSVAFRFASARGEGVRLYRLPDLEEVTWRFQLPDLTAERLIGFAPDEDLVYLESGAGHLMALDLSSGHIRTLDTMSVRTTVGPTQTLFAIRGDGTVGPVVEQRLEVWPDTLPTLPTHLWGTTAGRIVAVFQTEEGRFLSLVAEDGDAGPVPIPEGEITASHWGDLVVIGTDSALVAVSPDDGEVVGVLPQADRPLAVAFSSSAHRVYVVTPTGTILVVDRFEFIPLFERPLPGPAEAIRVDPLGRYLMLKPFGADSVWVLAAAGTEPLMSMAADWDDDLPAAGVDETILYRHGDSIIAVNPATGETTGVVADGAADPWMIVAWDPRRPALQLAVERRNDDAADEDGGEGLLYYAQLSSTSNLDWANDRVRELREAGLDAKVLLPSEWDDRYRVVLGPYPTRQTADDNGRKLGQAYFIISSSPGDSTTAR